MEMIPFAELFPVLERDERWVVELDEPFGALPAGEYRFFESYCGRPGCPCANVLVNVTDERGRCVAAINHPLRRGGAFGEAAAGDPFGKTFVQPYSGVPSAADPDPAVEDAALRLFLREVARPGREKLLRRHRRQMRESVDAVHGVRIRADEGSRFSNLVLRDRAAATERTGPGRRAAGSAAGARWPREGRNKPCPCGSGTTRKKCCEAKARSEGPVVRDAVAESSTAGITSPAVGVRIVSEEEAKRLRAVGHGRAGTRENLVAPVLSALERVGAITSLASDDGGFPTIGIEMDRGGEILPCRGAVVLVGSGRTAEVELPASTELFVGDALHPDFRDGPMREFVPFFALVERTAADVCLSDERVLVRDREFARLYDGLRRRPDSPQSLVVAGYVNAALRLAMCLRPTSRAEHDAVLRRLAGSAKTWSDGPVSTNYTELIVRQFVESRV